METATQNFTFDDIDFEAIHEAVKKQYREILNVVTYLSGKTVTSSQKYGYDSKEHETTVALYDEANKEYRRLKSVSDYCYMLSEGMDFRIETLEYRKAKILARYEGFRSAS